MEARIAVSAADYQPIAIANVLWSLATLQLPVSRGLWQALVPRALDILELFRPQTLSNVLWAVAHICDDAGKAHKRTLSNAKSSTAARLHPPAPAAAAGDGGGITGFTGHADDCANSAAEMAEVAALQKRLVWGLLDRCLQDASQFGPQSISSSLWALATLKLQPSPALALALQTSGAVTEEAWRPQGISITLWSLANLGIEVLPLLLRRLLSDAAAQADAFSPQAVANLLWATATLRLDPGRELVVGSQRSLHLVTAYN
jgi:hypothetical protein